MVHCHTVHLPLGALLIPCTMCGTGRYSADHRRWLAAYEALRAKLLFARSVGGASLAPEMLNQVLKQTCKIGGFPFDATCQPFVDPAPSASGGSSRDDGWQPAIYTNPEDFVHDVDKEARRARF